MLKKNISCKDKSLILLLLTLIIFAYFPQSTVKALTSDQVEEKSPKELLKDGKKYPICELTIIEGKK